MVPCHTSAVSLIPSIPACSVATKLEEFNTISFTSSAPSFRVTLIEAGLFCAVL